MQPQTPSPTPQYDFIFQDKQAPPKGPGFSLPKLPKPLLIALAGISGLIIVAVVYSVLTGGKSAAGQPYIDVLARGQEIIRVSTSVGTLAQDAPTQNLAATVQNSLTSEQTQITSYLTSQKITPAVSALAADQSSATDSQMQTASANGNLASVYASYLKTQLGLYESDLQTAYKTAGPNGKVALNNAYNNAQVLLQSSQVASAN